MAERCASDCHAALRGGPRHVWDADGADLPKLDAVNETVVIKQSLAATLAMFVPMAALAAAGGLYWLGSQMTGWAALALPVLLLALLTAVCAAVLPKRGPAMLQAL